MLDEFADASPLALGLGTGMTGLGSPRPAPRLRASTSSRNRHRLLWSALPPRNRCYCVASLQYFTFHISQSAVLLRHISLRKAQGERDKLWSKSATSRKTAVFDQKSQKTLDCKILVKKRYFAGCARFSSKSLSSVGVSGGAVADPAGSPSRLGMRLKVSVMPKPMP